MKAPRASMIQSARRGTLVAVAGGSGAQAVRERGGEHGRGRMRGAHPDSPPTAGPWTGGPASRAGPRCARRRRRPWRCLQFPGEGGRHQPHKLDELLLVRAAESYGGGGSVAAPSSPGAGGGGASRAGDAAVRESRDPVAGDIGDGEGCGSRLF